MKSWAQAGQDEWVIEQMSAIPAMLIPGSAAFMGFFVDIGAHDGIVHSNTYALETEYAWTGICIEPNREAYDSMSANRSNCVKTDLIVSDQHGIVEFDGVRVGQGSPRACMPLSMILDNARAPDTIDYLSIDVEGHELQVLDGMDFDRWHVRLITIEHNLYCDGPDRKNAIYERLTGHGFERVVEDVVAEGYGPYECWYVHP